MERTCRAFVALGLAAVMTVAGAGCAKHGENGTQTEGETEILELYEYDLSGMSEKTLLTLFSAFSRSEILRQLEANLIFEAATYDIFDVSADRLIRVDYDENDVPTAVRFTDEPEGETEPDDLPAEPGDSDFPNLLFQKA